MGRRGFTASVGAALLLASLATAAPASSAADDVATFRTISGSELCPPAGFDCFSTLLNPNGGGARVDGSAPVVVHTGHFPSAGPGLPVSILSGAAGQISDQNAQQGYQWRVLDQNGKVPTADTLAYFHASAPFTDAARAAREVIAFTDANGNARVNFTAPLAAAPVAVIVTGRSPFSGPGLPVNLVTSGYSRTGFTVRALDQAGAPIASSGIRLDYWATNQTATPNTRAGQIQTVPDANGRAFLPWSTLAQGVPPRSVVLTGTFPVGGPSMPVNLLAVVPQADGVAVRVLNQAGRPITSTVRIAFYATKSAASTS